MKILVVDDKFSARDQIVRSFSRRGHEVDELQFPDLESDKLKSAEFIFCDVDLRCEMNGVDFVRKIRDSGNMIPTAIMSVIDLDPAHDVPPGPTIFIIKDYPSKFVSLHAAFIRILNSIECGDFREAVDVINEQPVSVRKSFDHVRGILVRKDIDAISKFVCGV